MVRKSPQCRAIGALPYMNYRVSRVDRSTQARDQDSDGGDCHLQKNAHARGDMAMCRHGSSRSSIMLAASDQILHRSSRPCNKFR